MLAKRIILTPASSWSPDGRPSHHNAGVVSVLLAVVLTDLASKEIADSTLPFREPMGPFYRLHNPEFSLGIAGAHAQHMVVVMLGLLLAAGLVCLRLLRAQRITALAAGLALGGGAANTIDRLLHDAVRDFVVVGPVVINFADLAVLAGVVLVSQQLSANRLE